MGGGYNTTSKHPLKEKALKIMANLCHHGIRTAQIMPSTTWLDVKVFKEQNVYDNRTSFFAYENQAKKIFSNIFPTRYHEVFNQSYLTHFDYSDKDITGNDESLKWRIKQSGNHRPVVKFDLGFYDLCSCYYRFPVWFNEEHMNRFTRDADIMFTFDLDKNGRTLGKKGFPELNSAYFANTAYPKVKYNLAMFELREKQSKKSLINKVNAIINCMRERGLYTSDVCVYQDIGSVMGVFHCKKIRDFNKRGSKILSILGQTHQNKEKNQ